MLWVSSSLCSLFFEPRRRDGREDTRRELFVRRVGAKSLRLLS